MNCISLAVCHIHLPPYPFKHCYLFRMKLTLTKLFRLTIHMRMLQSKSITGRRVRIRFCECFWKSDSARWLPICQKNFQQYTVLRRELSRHLCKQRGGGFKSSTCEEQFLFSQKRGIHLTTYRSGRLLPYLDKENPPGATNAWRVRSADTSILRTSALLVYKTKYYLSSTIRE